MTDTIPTKKDLKLLQNAIEEATRVRNALLLEQGQIQANIKELESIVFRLENVIDIRRDSLAQLEEQKLQLEQDIDNLIHN